MSAGQCSTDTKPKASTFPDTTAAAGPYECHVDALEVLMLDLGLRHRIVPSGTRVDHHITSIHVVNVPTIQDDRLRTSERPTSNARNGRTVDTAPRRLQAVHKG